MGDVRPTYSERPWVRKWREESEGWLESPSAWELGFVSVRPPFSCRFAGAEFSLSSERARGSDGKPKGFNDKNKFKSPWVTCSGVDPGGCCEARDPGALQWGSWLSAIPSWFEVSPAIPCVTLAQAQFAHLCNGHGADDTNLMAFLCDVEMISDFHSFHHSI